MPVEVVLQQWNGHPLGGGVEQRDLERCALPGSGAGKQGLENGGMGVHAGGDVAGGNADPSRRFRQTRDRGKPAFSLDQQVVALAR